MKSCWNVYVVKLETWGIFSCLAWLDNVRFWLNQQEFAKTSATEKTTEPSSLARGMTFWSSIEKNVMRLQDFQILFNVFLICSFFVDKHRMTVKASCPMKLHRFPMDTQRCPLEVGSCEYCYQLIYRFMRVHSRSEKIESWVSNTSSR